MHNLKNIYDNERRHVHGLYPCRFMLTKDGQGFDLRGHGKC